MLYFLKFDLFANVSAIDTDYNFAIVGDWGCTSDTKKNSKFNTKYKPCPYYKPRRFIL